MALNTITDVLKYWLDSAHEKNKRIADYLDDIADCATRLADVWRQTVERCLEVAERNEESQASEWFKPIAIQTGLMHQMQAFYLSLDRVLTGWDQERCRDDLQAALLRLVRCRQEAKQKLSLFVTDSDPRTFFFEPEAVFEEMRGLKAAVMEIQQEAAAIVVLAKEYRATL